MHWSPLLLTLLVTATALAGCGGTTVTTTTTVVGKCTDSCVGADKGAVNGLVIDDRYRPVADAQVLLTPLGLTTTTDSEGQFSFGSLAPGTYVLLAQAKNHEAAPKNVDVRAGEYSEVEIQARRTFSQDGVIITTEFSIFIDCSEEAVVVTNEGNTNGVSCMMDQSGDSARGSFDSHLSAVDSNATTYMITEAVSNQKGSYGLMVGTVDSSDSVDKVYAWADCVDGTYARLQMEPNKVDKRAGEMQNGANAKWPASALFTTLIFPHAQFYKEIHDQTGGFGLGAVVGFKAKIVQTIFLGPPNVDVGNYTVLKPAG